jgi:hypothetical protein
MPDFKKVMINMRDIAKLVMDETDPNNTNSAYADSEGVINVGQLLMDGYLMATIQKDEELKIAYLVYSKVRAQKIDLFGYSIQEIHALVQETIEEFNDMATLVTHGDTLH